MNKQRSIWPDPQVGHGKSGIACVWNSGPPPHVGWWNASRDKVNDVNCWRWWDGKNWSFGVSDSALPAVVSSCSRNSWEDGVQGVYWSDYYPENARVPRVDPSLPENWAVVSRINFGTPTALQTVESLMRSRQLAAKAPMFKEVWSLNDSDRKVEEAKAVRSISANPLENITTGQLVSELLRRHG